MEEKEKDKSSKDSDYGKTERKEMLEKLIKKQQETKKYKDE